jgi:hypothetical protein
MVRQEHTPTWHLNTNKAQEMPPRPSTARDGPEGYATAKTVAMMRAHAPADTATTSLVATGRVISHALRLNAGMRRL